MKELVDWFKRLDFAKKVTLIYLVIGSFFILVFFNITDFLPVERNYLLNNLILIALFRLYFSAVVFYLILRYVGIKNELFYNKLLNTEKKYNILFNITSVVKVLVDYKTFTIIDANEAAYKFFGIKRSEQKSNRMRDLFSDETEFEYVKNFINSHPQSGSIIIKFCTRKKEEKYLEIFLDFVDFTIDGLVYLTVHDVTEKHNLEKQNEEYKKNLEKLVRERTTDLRKINIELEKENRRITFAEQRIENQLNFFKTIMDTIPIPVFIKGIDGKFLECNKSFCDYFELEKKDIIGLTSYDIIPYDFAKETEFYDDEIKRYLKGIRLERSFIGFDGQEHFIQYKKSPLLKTDGTIDGIVGIINDITEYRQLQLDIKKALEKEQEISGLKSRFISMASHEFRTPLTTILASADLLEMFGRNWSQEKYNEHTAKIRRTVKNMVELLDDVLTISRADTGKTTFNPVNMNLFNFCCEVVDNARAGLNAKQNIVFEYMDDRKIINGDVKLLGHILNNLLNNAVKYSPEGGDITFNINFDDTNREVVFLIKDRGIGISPEHLNILFEPFQRGENTGKIPGTGLGLSIVKRSVDMHNGKITCKSEIGHGTTFIISIPLE